jgi:hypothetical protein
VLLVPARPATRPGFLLFPVCPSHVARCCLTHPCCVMLFAIIPS